MRLVGYILFYMNKVLHRVWMVSQRSRFRSCGRNVRFGAGAVISFENTTVGDDVFIGAGANFSAAASTITIGSKVLFGPNVTIMTGDHRTDVVGAYMHDVVEKLPENDKAVVIEDDVWVGTGAVILKGVTIGRGSIIGAGSVVTRNVPPYTVHVGAPPLREWPRWDEKTIRQHEAMLGK